MTKVFNGDMAIGTYVNPENESFRIACNSDIMLFFRGTGYEKKMDLMCIMYSVIFDDWVPWRWNTRNKAG